jgi:hypothetical protein
MRSGGAGSAGARWACDGLNPERLAALPARHFRRPVLRSPANALRREADFALRRACAARSLCRTGVVSEAPERGAHRVVEAPPAGTALLPRSVPTRTARHGRRRYIPRIKWWVCQVFSPGSTNLPRANKAQCTHSRYSEKTRYTFQ